MGGIRMEISSLHVGRSVAVKEDLVGICRQSLVAHLMLKLRVRWKGNGTWVARVNHAASIGLNWNNRLANVLILIKGSIFKQSIRIVGQPVRQKTCLLLNIAASKILILLMLIIIRRYGPYVYEILMYLSIPLCSTSHSRWLWSNELWWRPSTSLT